MKLNTKIYIAARNVGDARDSGEFFHGELREALAWLMKKMVDLSMATRFEVCFGRSQEEVAKAIRVARGGKMSKIDEMKSMMDEIFSGFEEETDEESEKEAEFESKQPENDPLDNYQL